MTLQRKKEIGLVAVACLYTVLFWIGLALFIGTAEPTSSPLMVVITLAAIIWVIMVDFAMAVTPLIMSTVAIIVVAAGMVVVTGRASYASLIGAVLLAILLASAKQSMSREITNRVRYSTTQIFSAGARATMLGLVIAISSLSLPLISQNIFEEQLAIPEDYIVKAAQPLDPVIARLFPGTSGGSTIDDLINTQLAQQLPPGAVVTEAQRAVLRQELAVQIGSSKLAGSETFSRIAAQRVNSALKDLAHRNPLILAIALVIIVFLTLKALVPLLIWPVLGGLAGAMALARLVGLTYLLRTEATIERVTL